jgi:hypothetical protein
MESHSKAWEKSVCWMIILKILLLGKSWVFELQIDRKISVKSELLKKNQEKMEQF